MPAIRLARPLHRVGGSRAARAPPCFSDLGSRPMCGGAFELVDQGGTAMRRWTGLIVAVVSFAVLTLVAPSSAQQRQALGHHVRFDLVQIVQDTVLAGGADVGHDATSGDRVELTGSGEFKPGTGGAAGGGTFVHRRADESEVAHGIWVVTGFASWTPGGGSLPLADGIGEASEASAGIVTLNVRLIPEGGAPLSAILEVHCLLPGASIDTEEGIRLIVGPFVFEQDGGGTLFHILQ